MKIYPISYQHKIYPISYQNRKYILYLTNIINASVILIISVCRYRDNPPLLLGPSLVLSCRSVLPSPAKHHSCSRINQVTVGLKIMTVNRRLDTCLYYDYTMIATVNY